MKALGRTSLSWSLLLGLLCLAPGASFAQGTSTAPAAVEGSVTDDWLQLDGAKSKVFLPGMWAYKVETSPEGTMLEVHGGSGKLILTVQTIEGKQEATPEKLQAIFEEHIAKGAQHTDEKSEVGLQRRYTAKIEGQDAILKGLFVRHNDVGYMVYIQALSADVTADAGIEKLMDSVIGSFRPV